MTITYVQINAAVLEQLAADNARLREAVTAALERLDASLFSNAEHQQAKDILRAALKPHPE